MGELDTLITPLVRDNKMSPEAIVAVFKNRISVSASTLRRYIDRGGVGAIRLDLLKAPKRKVRKKRKVHSGHHTDDGRSYSDFEALSTRDKSLAWELDTVCGSKKDRCRFLTLCQRETNFLFIFKIFRNDQESVIGILDYLEALCEDSGYTFSSIFGVLLTDNGSEFGDAKGIETSSLSSAKRCDLYYCDPYSSWQKPHVELAHTLIRRVLPKGTSFESISHRQVSTLCSHINSYPRASLGTSSIEKMGDRLPESLLWEIGVSVIPVKEVYLRPGLLGQTL
jgi:IS30 family transposase